MLELIVIVVFIFLPALIVWRFYKRPVKADIPAVAHGVIAGLTGGSIGATASSFIFGVNGFLVIGYVYWLVAVVPAAIVFACISDVAQRRLCNFNLPLRIVLGACLGSCTVWMWFGPIDPDDAKARIWFIKGIMAMFICSGIVSGILTGKENQRR